MSGRLQAPDYLRWWRIISWKKRVGNLAAFFLHVESCWDVTEKKPNHWKLRKQNYLKCFSISSKKTLHQIKMAKQWRKASRLNEDIYRSCMTINKWQLIQQFRSGSRIENLKGFLCLVAFNSRRWGQARDSFFPYWWEEGSSKTSLFGKAEKQKETIALFPVYEKQHRENKWCGGSSSWQSHIVHLTAFPWNSNQHKGHSSQSSFLLFSKAWGKVALEEIWLKEW